ncbi:undecaprenyl-diphosphate phosphatase [Frankia sp. B2]|uniref:Undecaprenyl-diphosphatase 2 n=1 Tax=Frankia casuarinae (strain DSM 45818 / CECT 9043 / HFP020203 / CcI3) TaxID=106370 RepID=UPPP2_FRACC|nr:MULTISPECIES: undecaprenyl-diphosphate phosphatase [Frankia]Q2J987.1 RecName: Full=Undecaprenyl-diphosphatase 2; AltName: Full=Bacitracin resistance protein 2; AltName: Full=Undecaprenyl pyrophosphate phosphatase 2 [Frankia casuarinae]ABD12155.1 Undecaprenyl-diphosphatase [Frankia casuarinae]ETA02454.1 putative bacitracin resistance protein [Frankia sp. CcI6]OHV48654.1 undecaprenyl-diphosphatase UppP [Frankia sp. CgIS1]TFE33821.1 undecaprenyl-diphosphate phosphatase [Frankia sp. B2]
MNFFEGTVLGLVQGLTEFLPVSSSAHLRIAAALAGWEDPGAAFTAVTQIGTETAVLIYFRRDIARIVAAWARSLTRREMRKDPDARTGWLVILGTLPIGLLGVTLQDAIEGPFRDLRLIATTLIVLGLILGGADWYASKGRPQGRHSPLRPRKVLEDLSVRDGLLYGLAQSAALIPGVSRSGATISGGLLLGYTREAAARYSFLLAMPAVLASGVFELRSIGGKDADVAWGPTILATFVAFVTGYAAIAWFLRYISTRSFAPFVLYRVGLGLLLFSLLVGGALSPDAGAPPG